jgi:[ribosomal protein S5]-alanine N-acetyltransferase
VTLVPVPPSAITGADAFYTGGRPAGRGWPHDDTAAALSFAATGGWTWLVVDEAGAVVGECGTKSQPSPDGVVEIGYGLAAPSRGRGLGTRAVATLLRWLAARPEVRVVEAHVAPDNVPSRRLLEAHGFAVAGAGDDELVYRLGTDGAGAA